MNILDKFKQLTRFGRPEDGGLWYYHSQNLNEKRDGTEGPMWRHGRSWFRFAPLWKTVGISWCIPTHFCHVSFTAGDGDGNEYSFAIANYLFAIWFHVEAKSALEFKGAKTVELKVHDQAIWWRLWSDRDSWSSKTPRWRDGNFHPIDFLLGRTKHSSKVIEECDVLIPMPERSYKGKAKLTVDTWTRPNWPYWPFTNQLMCCNIEMHKDEQIPVPGKGENSWDCGEDAYFSFGTGQVRNISEAVGKAVASALNTRLRYGGKNWKPSSKVAEEDAS